MNREHPTGTERKSLNYECGWKGGDRGGLTGQKKFAERKRIVEKSKKLLTGVGLLMEGVESDPYMVTGGKSDTPDLLRIPRSLRNLPERVVSISTSHRC
jgi:hypothetical protein